ncbi:uncharacterized protein METZ01_LOCUS473967, partial [marine metagenome]
MVNPTTFTAFVLTGLSTNIHDSQPQKEASAVLVDFDG